MLLTRELNMMVSLGSASASTRSNDCLSTARSSCGLVANNDQIKELPSHFRAKMKTLPMLMFLKTLYGYYDTVSRSWLTLQVGQSSGIL
jgi:hypothetical protein